MVNQGCDENFPESLELEEKMAEDRDLRNPVFCDKGETDEPWVETENKKPRNVKKTWKCVLDSKGRGYF